MRHTALTRLGEHCDVFTLAPIAGHSSITMTLRYVHPQAETIERAFAKVGSHRIGHDQETGGLLPAQKSAETPLVTKRSSGEPGRTRTSNPLLNCQSPEINGFSDFRAVQVGRFERFWSRLLPSCYHGDEHRCIS
jgi:hypothetical protein